jgi:PKD repeat protein
MKHLYLSLISAFLFTLSSAQITISQSAMPAAGDTIRYSTATIPVTLDVKTTGANQTWDYSSLVSNGQDIYKYLAASKTPYAFYYFNQIGLKTADSIGASTFSFKNIYSFFSKSSSVFKANGIGYSYAGFPLAAKNTDDDEIYQFPLDYHDSDVSTFRFIFSIPGQTLFSYVQVGTRTNVVDGYGSIKTPYKTYSSVLRVKTYMDEVDSLVTQFAKIPIPRKQVIYKWLAASEHIPVLEITGTEVAGTFTPSQIRFRDQYNGKQSAFRPHASFTVDKTVGVVNTDTFKLTSRSLLATNFQWQITPVNSSAKFVAATSATTQNPRLVFTKAGVYTVSLTATNTFGTDDTTVADLITITDPNNSISKVNSANYVLYPNPVQNTIAVLGDALQTYKIVDLAGNVVAENASCNQKSIDVSLLSTGMYLLRFETKNAAGTWRFMKQ